MTVSSEAPPADDAVSMATSLPAAAGQVMDRSAENRGSASSELSARTADETHRTVRLYSSDSDQLASSSKASSLASRQQPQASWTKMRDEQQRRGQDVAVVTNARVRRHQHDN